MEKLEGGVMCFYDVPNDAELSDKEKFGLIRTKRRSILTCLV